MTGGHLAWGAIVGGVLAFQGFTLVRNDDRWPAFSDILRTVLRNPLGRWVLFAIWLWLGWHLFMRGWKFFLRAP